jgi:hypothetical protein
MGIFKKVQEVAGALNENQKSQKPTSLASHMKRSVRSTRGGDVLASGIDAQRSQRAGRISGSKKKGRSAG